MHPRPTGTGVSAQPALHHDQKAVETGLLPKVYDWEKLDKEI